MLASLDGLSLLQPLSTSALGRPSLGCFILMLPLCCEPLNANITSSFSHLQRHEQKSIMNPKCLMTLMHMRCHAQLVLILLLISICITLLKRKNTFCFKLWVSWGERSYFYYSLCLLQYLAQCPIPKYVSVPWMYKWSVSSQVSSTHTSGPRCTRSYINCASGVSHVGPSLHSWQENSSIFW